MQCFGGENLQTPSPFVFVQVIQHWVYPNITKLNGFSEMLYEIEKEHREENWDKFKFTCPSSSNGILSRWHIF